MRPSANVTVQGPDVMALTLTYHTTPARTLVESKFRSTISPAEVLGEIQHSLGRIDKTYIVSAWRAAHRAMQLHPAPEAVRALGR